MEKVDVLILPSLIEGIPTVVLEAFASGCCVVAKNVGGVSELVNSKNGYLLKDSEDFSKKIDFLYENQDLMKRKGLEGRKLVEKHYTWERILEKFEKAIS